MKIPVSLLCFFLVFTLSSPAQIMVEKNQLIEQFGPGYTTGTSDNGSDYLSYEKVEEGLLGDIIIKTTLYYFIKYNDNIDYCIDSIMEIMKNPAAEGIFHIINARNTALEDLILFTKKFLNVSGLSIGGSSGRHTKRIPGPLDLLLQRSLETYKSYIEDTRIFNDSRAAQILDPSGINCPKFSYPVFERCMTYAIDNKWGKSLGF